MKSEKQINSTRILATAFAFCTCLGVSAQACEGVATGPSDGSVLSEAASAAKFTQLMGAATLARAEVQNENEVENEMENEVENEHAPKI